MSVLCVAAKISWALVVNVQPDSPQLHTEHVFNTSCYSAAAYCQMVADAMTEAFRLVHHPESFATCQEQTAGDPTHTTNSYSPQ